MSDDTTDPEVAAMREAAAAFSRAPAEAHPRMLEWLAGFLGLRATCARCSKVQVRLHAPVPARQTGEKP